MQLLNLGLSGRVFLVHQLVSCLPTESYGTGNQTDLVFMKSTVEKILTYVKKAQKGDSDAEEWLSAQPLVAPTINLVRIHL